MAELLRNSLRGHESVIERLSIRGLAHPLGFSVGIRRISEFPPKGWAARSRLRRLVQGLAMAFLYQSIERSSEPTGYLQCNRGMRMNINKCAQSKITQIVDSNEQSGIGIPFYRVGRSVHFGSSVSEWAVAVPYQSVDRTAQPTG